MSPILYACSVCGNVAVKHRLPAPNAPQPEWPACNRVVRVTGGYLFAPTVVTFCNGVMQVVHR